MCMCVVFVLCAVRVVCGGMCMCMCVVFVLCVKKTQFCVRYGGKRIHDVDEDDWLKSRGVIHTIDKQKVFETIL